MSVCLAGGILARHGYAEIRKIGEGSFGQALLVQDAKGLKLVCKTVNVSQASPKEAQETLKEAQLLAAFKHPFIVEYTANFIDSGWLCILMQFCEGGDLAAQVEAARQARSLIEERRVLRWMTQALLALQYIHGKRVLHRDLKSSNFFLSKAGNLKMGDFGIAKVLTCTQACANTQIGTPQYLSPEAVEGKPYTWPSDIWALGCIMYELCALKLPFDGGNSMLILIQNICRGPTPSIPDSYSSFSRQLCHSMLSKNPACRPSACAILNRRETQAIVQQFFEEARMKAARDESEAAPDQSEVFATVAPEPEQAPAPVKCSTLMLDEMLCEANDAVTTSPTRAAPACAMAAKVEEAAAKVKKDSLSIVDECTELLKELGLATGEVKLSCLVDELCPPSPNGSLTQAELDILSSSLCA